MAGSTNATMSPVHLLVESLTLERQHPRRRAVRRMWSLDNLPQPRAWFYGPKWKRHFNVQERPIAEIDPVAAQLHRPGRKLLMFTFEDEVRELTSRGFNEPEEIRPGVFAEWDDHL
jgi:hypothetical protein